MIREDFILLKDVLGQLLSLNIQFLHPENPELFRMDLGLRQLFQNSESLYEDLQKTIRANLQPQQLLHLQNAFMHYLLFYLDAETLCTVGPFITVSQEELPTGFQYLNSLRDYISPVPQLEYEKVEAAAVQMLRVSGCLHPILRNFRQPTPGRVLLASSADSTAKPILPAEARLSAPTRKALQYIRTHLSSKLSLDILADHLGFSPTYLSHSFKKELGIAPIQYIIRLRMEAARLQLRLTDRDIQQIAIGVGISDLSYFSKLFRQTTGTTPSQYRKQFR